MFTDYTRVLWFIKTHLPEATDANKTLLVTNVLDHIYQDYKPDYLNMPDYAARELECVKYDPNMDQYKTIYTGVFAALSIITQDDLTCRGKLSTNPSDPCTVAARLDKLRYRDTSYTFMKGMLPGLPKRDIEFSNYTEKLRKQMIKEINDIPLANQLIQPNTCKISSFA